VESDNSDAQFQRIETNITETKFSIHLGYRVSTLSCAWARQLLQNIAADAGFL